LLRTHDIEPEIVEYLKTPPTADELKRLLALMDMEPRDLIRRKEREFKELGLADTDLSDDALIRAMVDHPRLLERPIVVSGDRAVLGRPTERILEIL